MKREINSHVEFAIVEEAFRKIKQDVSKSEKEVAVQREKLEVERRFTKMHLTTLKFEEWYASIFMICKAHADIPPYSKVQS